MQGVRDYLKFIKRGYSRPSHLVSLDLRNKRISKKEANNLIKNYEGKRPPSLDIFLKLVGITEAEFMQIALSHQVSPFKGKFKNVKKGKKTNDYSKWSKSGSMERSYSKEQFNRFKYLLND